MVRDNDAHLQYEFDIAHTHTHTLAIPIYCGKLLFGYSSIIHYSKFLFVLFRLRLFGRIEELAICFVLSFSFSPYFTILVAFWSLFLSHSLFSSLLYVATIRHLFLHFIVLSLSSQRHCFPVPSSFLYIVLNV